MAVSVVFICISLMIGDVKHLLRCLFAFFLSSLKTCQFISFGFFKLACLIFLLLIFENSLYILQTISLSDICFANISQSVTFQFLSDCIILIFSSWLGWLKTLSRMSLAWQCLEIPTMGNTENGQKCEKFCHWVSIYCTQLTLT